MVKELIVCEDDCNTLRKGWSGKRPGNKVLRCLYLILGAKESHML